MTALRMMAQSNRAIMPTNIVGLVHSGSGGGIPRTQRLDSFTLPEEKVGLAVALKYANQARNSGDMEATQVEQLFPGTFSVGEAEKLARLMNQADIQLQREPLLDQGERPGLVFSVTGRTKGLLAHKYNDGRAQRQDMIKQVTNILKAKQIRPSLYTGHKLGGDLAHFAHKQMGDLEALSLSFDARTHRVTNGLKQINVPLEKKARELGGVIEKNNFDRLLANTTLESHTDLDTRAVGIEDRIEEQIESHGSNHEVSVPSLPFNRVLPTRLAKTDASPSSDRFKNGAMQSLAAEQGTRPPPAADTPLQTLPLVDLYHADPMALIDAIGQSDQSRDFSMVELLNITDLPSGGGNPLIYQALLLRHSGQIYKAVSQGPEALEQFIDQLLLSPELVQALGQGEAQNLATEAKAHFQQMDLPSFKNSLELELRRQAQAYVFDHSAQVILDRTNQVPANAPDAEIHQHLARADQAMAALAEEALALYREIGYLRLPTGHLGKPGHATALTLEKVQTAKGKENLAVFFDSGDHLLRGQLKSPASDGQAAKYQARPQAYVGVELDAKHLVNLIKGKYGLHSTLRDIEHTRHNFRTLSANDISTNLAQQQGVRAVDLQALAPDQGQKGDSCALKSAQAPLKDKFPLLASVAKVIRLKEALASVAAQRSQQSGEQAHQQPQSHSSGKSSQGAEQESQWQAIEARAQEQLRTHSHKMVAMLRAGEALASNQLINKGRIPADIPPEIQALAQRSGDLVSDPFSALPYQHNNLPQLERLQVLALEHRASRNKPSTRQNNNAITNLLSTLTSLKQQAQQNKAYLAETEFGAARPQYHRDIKAASTEFANQLLASCQQQAVALRIRLGDDPALMLLEQAAPSAPFQVTLLAPNLAAAHNTLETGQAQDQSAEPGSIRFILDAEVLSPQEGVNVFAAFVFAASSANKDSQFGNIEADAYNLAVPFSILNSFIENPHSQAINSDLPQSAPKGMLLLDMLSQHQLGKDSADYGAIFGRYTQEIQEQATAAKAIPSAQVDDPRYGHLLALGEQLKVRS